MASATLFSICAWHPLACGGTWVGCATFRTLSLQTEHGLFCNQKISKNVPTLETHFPKFILAPTIPEIFFEFTSSRFLCFQHTAWTCFCVHLVCHCGGISVYLYFFQLHFWFCTFCLRKQAPQIWTGTPPAMSHGWALHNAYWMYCWQR